LNVANSHQKCAVGSVEILEVEKGRKVRQNWMCWSGKEWLRDFRVIAGRWTLLYLWVFSRVSRDLRGLIRLSRFIPVQWIASASLWL